MQDSAFIFLQKIYKRRPKGENSPRASPSSSDIPNFQTRVSVRVRHNTVQNRYIFYIHLRHCTNTKTNRKLPHLTQADRPTPRFRWQRRSRRVRFALCQAFLKFPREKSFWRRIDCCPFVWIWNVAMEARRNKIFIIREKIAVLRKNFPQEFEK